MQTRARNRWWSLAGGLLLLTVVLAGCATTPEEHPKTLPEPSALPSHPGLPDPLVMYDGRRVTRQSQWLVDRRYELKVLFQYYMYGTFPPRPPYIKADLGPAYPDFLDGKATLKFVTLQTGGKGAPRIDLMLVVPNQRAGRVPVFLAMNFCGNDALTTDPRVPLTRGWVYDNCPGCSNNAATDDARGSQAADWPLARIVERGYALATFCSSDVDSDRSDVSDGLYAWLAGNDAARNQPTNRGTLAAWAWGFQRGVDYLGTDPAIDARRIAVVGHSRNGKAALLAAAFDDRIALVIPHQAGCGGTAPSRSSVGESIKAINDRFPHWFNAEFKKFDDMPDRLPFDQDCLVALCAPRPVLVTAARDDTWSNPDGTFVVAQAASPVYRLLGAQGLAADAMPPLGQLVASPLGFYIRAGGPSMTAADWEVFMDFADRQFGKAPK